MDKFSRKSNKILQDQFSEFDNKSVNSWLLDKGTEKYSTHIKGKPVVSERFIRTLKNKIYKHMTAVSKNVYMEKLNQIVDKCNSTADIISGT